MKTVHSGQKSVAHRSDEDNFRTFAQEAADRSGISERIGYRQGSHSGVLHPRFQAAAQARP